MIPKAKILLSESFFLVLEENNITFLNYFLHLSALIQITLNFGTLFPLLRGARGIFF